MTDRWEGHTAHDLHSTTGRRAWANGEWCYEDAPCSICWEHLYGDPDEVRQERDRLKAEVERLRDLLDAVEDDLGGDYLAALIGGASDD